MIKVVIILFSLLIGWTTYQAPNPVDVWLTPDQQGDYYFGEGNYAIAAQRYKDPYRKGLSFYAAGDFVAARTTFQSVGTTAGLFYIANAYAQEERFVEAIEYYEAVLTSDPDFEEAYFNLNYVKGLRELDEKDYEDVGGTGGKLEADEIVFDDKADNAVGEMTEREIRDAGVSDAALKEMWMRRVETTPGDFLSLKFSYQLSAARQRAKEEEEGEEQ